MTANTDYYTTAIHTGNAHSLEREERLCACGEYYYAPKNQLTRMKRCPTCQERHENDASIERTREKRKRGMSESASNRSFSGDYVIVKDPGESWWPGGSLNESEIKRMTRIGELDDGMVWESESKGKRIVITGREYKVYELIKAEN